MSKNSSLAIEPSVESFNQHSNGSSGRGHKQQHFQKVVPFPRSTQLVTSVSPDAIRFQIPPQKTYPMVASIASILSLVFMSAIGVSILYQFANAGNDINWFGILPSLPSGVQVPLWAKIPFIAALFGSGVGALFEAVLLLTGHAFQEEWTSWTRMVSGVRRANLGAVCSSFFFFVFCLGLPSASTDTRLILFCMSAAGAASLAFPLFFASAPGYVLGCLVSSQLAQIIALFALNPVPGNFVATLLIVQSVLQLASLLVGVTTPRRSAIFHTLGTVAIALCYRAFSEGTSLVSTVAPSLPASPFWIALVSALAGWIGVAYFSAETWNDLRAVLTNWVWAPLNFMLVGQPRFANPVKLSDVYKKTKPTKTELKPYYQNHSGYQVQCLSIPSAVKLEGNVLVFNTVVQRVKKIFGLIKILDSRFPQTNVNVPLKDKQRMEIWSDGSNYWPSILTKKIFGMTVPDHGKFDPASSVAIEAFKKGQILALFAESGVASTFLKAVPEHDGMLMLDFRFLESYETKPDYESYGGVAFFRINPEKQCLELISIIAPHSTEEIAVDPSSATFRRAESLVLASMYYEVVSGKHLSEIHMTYNLIEVAMHNVFDVQGQWKHPFRTFLYIHFFSHELAEEMTTEHLVQEGAVFNQIFSTTHNAMVDHINDTYNRFQYGTDENFEARAALLTQTQGKGAGSILPNSCIKWELEYAQIWQRYTSSLIDAIYKNDQAVRDDQYLQEFHAALLVVLRNGLPDRYEDFKTKAGVARFASDTIHHTVIRHQVYGTTGVTVAMDPRINKVQVPRDGGTSSIEEWRSLALVALATGKARFTLLLNDFKYLLSDVDDAYRGSMQAAFDQLQQDLRALEKKWNSTEQDKKWNKDYFRPVPSDLRTGPGY